MNIYKRIFYPVHIGIVHFTILSFIFCAGYLVIDAVPLLLSGDHSPWYKWALFADTHILRICSQIILFSAMMGALCIGVPKSFQQLRFFARYCHVKGLKLSALSHYSDYDIKGIKPFLEKLDDKSRVYFDEYVQEHYFEAPELVEILRRDRFKISQNQYNRAVLGTLSKDKLIAKAKKKSRHPWFRPSNL